MATQWQNQQRKSQALTEHYPGIDLPAINRIGFADLKDALVRGFDDFWAMPSQLLFLGLIYPVMGILLARVTLGQEMLPLLFPLAAGFALIGPVAATGLYELSRRREQGLEASWKHAFGVLTSPSMWSIAMLGLVLTAIFVVWLYAAQSIYESAFGLVGPASLDEFVQQVLNTEAGWYMIAIGNFVGFLFAVLALSISVVSFPLMLDRHVGPVVAMLTSLRAVERNPIQMAAWGLIVAALLALGSLPLLVGLIIVMPVLGHATWHLYRKVVAH